MTNIKKYRKQFFRINILTTLIILFSISGLHIYENLFQKLYIEDSSLLNLLGRQRMLAQRGAKVFVLLGSQSKSFDSSQLTNELKEVMDQIILMHNAFLSGNPNLEIKAVDDNELKRGLRQADPHLVLMTRLYRSVLKENDGTSTINPPGDRERYQFVTACNHFTSLMDRLVNSFGNETHTKIYHHGIYEFIEITFILAIVFFTGFIGYRKIIKKILSEMLQKN